MASEPCITKHVVEVFDRGGTNKIAELTDVAQVAWGRVRDDISTASLRLNAQSCAAQADTLGDLRSGRHEIVVWRDGERSWEGPITRMAGTRNSFEVFASDVVHYAARTTMRSGYDNSAKNVGYVIDRAALILNTELARKEALDPPYNVLPYLTLHQTPTDARTTARTLPYQYQVFEHIDQLAAKSGIDYTAVGRAIHLWDTHQPLGILQETATQADFLGDLVVTEYGMELCTHNHVTDGEGHYGSSGANDPYYGEIELLATAYDETEGADPPSSSVLAGQAQRNRAGRLPAPVQVRVPENSTIDPTGALKLPLLVPGVWIKVQADVVGFKVHQMQKLSNLRVVETGAGETISVSMFPASMADEAEEEEGE